MFPHKVRPNFPSRSLRSLCTQFSSSPLTLNFPFGSLRSWSRLIFLPIHRDQFFFWLTSLHNSSIFLQAHFARTTLQLFFGLASLPQLFNFSSGSLLSHNSSIFLLSHNSSIFLLSHNSSIFLLARFARTTLQFFFWFASLA